jgi:hypothetical protein
MTYFDCFVVGAWMFAIGWALGAIHVQNQTEKTGMPPVVEQPDMSPECEALPLAVTASTCAAD